MKDKMPKWLRTSIFAAAGVIVLAAVVVGVMLYMRNNSGTVNVYAVTDFCTQYSADEAQTEGVVRTDKLQSVYVSATQKVTEFYVKEGDTVHEGDPILAFDTTLTDLELERKNIAVQQLQLDLEAAERNLAKINTYKVYVPPVEDPTEPTPLKPLSVPFFRGGSGTLESPYIYIWNDTCTFDNGFINTILPVLPEEFNPETDTVPTACVVFEVRESDSMDGEVLRSWMMTFWRTETGYYEFSILEAPAGYNGESGESGEDIPVDTTVYYSWNEILSMRREAQEKITKLELDLKKAELDYKTLQYELTNGMVYSKIDGVVKALRDPDEARESNEPVALISGGGGYFVRGALSETELPYMHVGDTVTALSWQSYETVEGTITEISEYPVGENEGYYHWTNSGNNNTTLYPFIISIDENANIREGEYLQITYNPFGGGGDSLFLESMFIRRENGKSYVFAADAEGRLERREVTLGRSLWGSYFEIVSGLASDDYVAFPYGRSIREGAKTEVASPETLYSY